MIFRRIHRLNFLSRSLVTGALLLSAIAGAVEPSRYAGEDPTEYIRNLEANLAAAARPTDPFGLLQDPDAKPVAPKPQADPGPRRPAIPLADIVGRIQINTIMPADRRFLIGSRVVNQGEVLPVSYQGSVINLRIDEVSSRRIVFTIPETGDTYAREMDVLPPGMSRGSGNAAPPGMVPNRSETPLQLDPAPQNSPNRR